MCRWVIFKKLLAVHFYPRLLCKWIGTGTCSLTDVCVSLSLSRLSQIHPIRREDKLDSGQTWVTGGISGQLGGSCLETNVLLGSPGLPSSREGRVCWRRTETCHQPISFLGDAVRKAWWMVVDNYSFLCSCPDSNTTSK